jgi:hypothetical protein
MITFRGKKALLLQLPRACLCPRTVYLLPHKINSHSRSTAETSTVSNCNLHHKHRQAPFLQDRLGLPSLIFRPLPHRPYEHEHHYRRSASQPCCIHCPPSNPSSHFAQTSLAPQARPAALHRPCSLPVSCSSRITTSLTAAVLSHL